MTQGSFARNVQQKSVNKTAVRAMTVGKDVLIVLPLASTLADAGRLIYRVLRRFPTQRHPQACQVLLMDRTVPGAATAGRWAASIRYAIEFKSFAVATCSKRLRSCRSCVGLFFSKEPH